MDRAEWLKKRQNSVGASEAAALFNLHPYLSPFALWAQKTGEAKVDDDEQTEYQERGLALEPYLRQKYAKTTGRVVRGGELTLYYAFECDRASATPDGLVEEIPGGAPTRVLELKSWSHFGKDSEIPAYAQIQVQQQMLCTSLQGGSFSIDGAFGKWAWLDVDRNEDFILLLIEKIEEFWHHVTTGIPPAVDSHRATTEALKRLHPRDSGATIELDQDALVLAKRLEGTKEAVKRLQSYQAGLENAIRAQLGDNTYGVLPNGDGLSLKTTKRAGYTVEECEFRALRAVSPKTMQKVLEANSKKELTS